MKRPSFGIIDFAVIGCLLLLAFGQVDGCTSIGSPPPFKADKPSVLIIEETLERGKYTADQLNAIDATDAKSIKAKLEARGGRFFHLDKDVDAGRMALAPAWAQEAFKADPKTSYPWALGAGPSNGFSVPLTTEADLATRAEGLR